jgi:hypothetical protein
MSVPWERPSPCEVPAELEKSLMNAARTTKRATLSVAKLDKPLFSDTYIKAVIEDPSVQACMAWLTAYHPLFGLMFHDGLLDHNTDRIRDFSSMILDGSKWRVDLKVDQLYEQFWRTLATPEMRQPLWNPIDGGYVNLPSDECPSYPPRTERNPLFLTARAIGDGHAAFVDQLRSSLLVASGMPEKSRSMEDISAELWDEPAIYFDVSSNVLFEAERDHSALSLRRIFRQLRLALPAGEARPRRRGPPRRIARLIDALRGMGITSGGDFEGHTISKLAAKLQQEVKGWEHTDDPVESLRKVLERLKKEGFR